MIIDLYVFNCLQICFALSACNIQNSSGSDIVCLTCWLSCGHGSGFENLTNDKLYMSTDRYYPGECVGRQIRQ